MIWRVKNELLPMLVQYYGNGHAVSIQNPVPFPLTANPLMP